MGHKGRGLSCPSQSQSQSHVVIILLDCLIWKTTEKLVPWCSMRVSIYYELLKYNWHVHWLLSIHNEPFLSINIRSLRLKKVPGSRNGVYGTPWWDVLVEWVKPYDCYLWLRSSSLSLNTGLQVYGTPWWDVFVEWLKSYDCYLWLRSSSLSLNTGLQSFCPYDK